MALAGMVLGDTALAMALADTAPLMGLPTDLADTVLVPADTVPMRLPISPCPAPPAAAVMADTAAAIAAVMAAADMADTAVADTEATAGMEVMADTKSPAPRLSPA